MAERIVAGRAGVLLTKGDFVDGEFRGLEGDRVKVSSVLFGLRSYDTRKDVLAVVLRDIGVSSSAYEVRLRDQSILQAAIITFERDALGIQDSMLGTLRVPIDELASIQRRVPAAPVRRPGSPGNGPAR
jgi:hypothetical protein